MKKPIEWRQVSVEMTSIIFAVLLALGLEGWMQDRELTVRADQMLVRITAEVKGNRIDLQDALKENQLYIDGISAALAKNEVAFADVAPFIKISAGGGDNAAWSSAKMTDAISIMPLDTMKTLADIYSTQSYYIEYSKALMLRYADISINIQKPTETKDQAYKFVMHLQVLNTLGTQLNEGYNAFLGLDEIIVGE